VEECKAPCHRRAGAAVKDGQVLRPVLDAPVVVAPIRLRVADDLAHAVHRAVGGLADDLRPAIAIQVIDHELRVVRPLADVFAQVDLPKERAVHLISLKYRRIRKAGLRVVAPHAGLMQDDLVVAVAVQVAHRAVVGM